jgi:nitrite reductase/ring-hydroxylating ferredoxin subunit
MAHVFMEDLIDQQQWLEPTGDAIQQAIGKVVPREGAARSFKDFLHGTWFGHPVHPALTDLPTGAWTASLVMDVLSASGNPAVRRGADMSLKLGVIGAVGAALTGLADWQETYGRERRVGLLHGLLNTTALTLYTTSWLLRRGKRLGTAVFFSTLGYGFAALAAYVGGELVFGQGVGVNRAAWLQAPEDFTPVLDESALPPEQPTRVLVGETPVVLVKRGGKIYALTAVCTHAGGPLDEGTLEGDTIVCPWHGSRFCLRDGSVEGGPATFAERTFEARTRSGKIELRRSEAHL